MSPAEGDNQPKRDRSEVREALAAEYALGTLHGRARHRFERWSAEDPDLRHRVHRWEVRLGSLVEEAEPLPPPSGTWKAIQRRIGGRHSAFPLGSALWSSLPFWRGAALAATLLLALTLGWMLRPGTDGGMPERLAVVRFKESEPLWVLTSGADSGTIRVRTVRDASMGEGRVCPLWIKRQDTGEMRMVGILPEKPGRYTLKLPGGMERSLARTELMISVEPKGDMPRDRPTGEMMYRGEWITL